MLQLTEFRAKASCVELRQLSKSRFCVWRFSSIAWQPVVKSIRVTRCAVLFVATESLFAHHVRHGANFEANKTRCGRRSCRGAAEDVQAFCDTQETPLPHNGGQRRRLLRWTFACDNELDGTGRTKYKTHSDTLSSGPKAYGLRSKFA